MNVVLSKDEWVGGVFTTTGGKWQHNLQMGRVFFPHR